jgi:hypothetical protein
MTQASAEIATKVDGMANKERNMKTIALTALVLTLSWAHFAVADCCDHCGCQCECQKVCRLICETKKVTKPEYSCECEDFCVPGPSEHCVTRDECGCKKHVYTPTCATVRTRTKLVKKEVTKEVPSYRWVVEKVCPACACKTGDTSSAAPDNASASNTLVPTPAAEEDTPSERGGVARFISAAFKPRSTQR